VRETLAEAHNRARLAEKRMAEHPTMKAAAAPVDGGLCAFCRINRADLCQWGCK
jgi:hypothetical protein